VLILGQLLLDPEQPPVPGWLVVADGRIVDLGHRADGAPPANCGVDGPTIGDDELLVVPGFIDAHMHLPQIECVGCDGLDLLEWLDRIIFPAESGWHEMSVVRRHVDLAVRRLRAAGTLGAAAFASPVAAAMPPMLDALGGHGVRFVVGQALMDRHAPHALIDEPLWRPTGARMPDVELSVNPRFAISCTDALLAEAAAFAATLDRPLIHTHLAESLPECDRVGELFPDDPSYTAVYDRHGLLGDRTLLAHAVHLDDADWRLIAERNSTVVHCPQANLFLRSGLFDLRAARDHGVRVALGSDIAAGCDLAMPRVARSMIEVAKVRSMTVDPEAAASIPSPADAWRMITEGNADALGWVDGGRIAVGARAELLLLRLPFPIDDRHLVGRMIHGWENDWIFRRIDAPVASR